MYCLSIHHHSRKNFLLLVQRSQSFHDRHLSSTARSTMSSSTRAISSSRAVSEISSLNQSINYHEIYERILPYVRHLSLGDHPYRTITRLDSS